MARKDEKSFADVPFDAHLGLKVRRRRAEAVRRDKNGGHGAKFEDLFFRAHFKIFPENSKNGISPAASVLILEIDYRTSSDFLPFFAQKESFLFPLLRNLCFVRQKGSQRAKSAGAASKDATAASKPLELRRAKAIPGNERTVAIRANETAD